MIKLVVSDMDGTLLDANEGISKGNKQAIEKLQNKNIEFAIASGRNWDGVYSIMHSYGIKCEAILGNGAQYVDKDGKILMSCYMNKKVLKDVVKIFHTRNIPYLIFTNKGFYTIQECDYVRDQYIERTTKKFHTNKEDYKPGGSKVGHPCMKLKKINDLDAFIGSNIEIIKVEAFSIDASVIPPCKELLKDIPTISYLSSFEDNVEVTDYNAQKGLILEKVIKLKGLTKEEVMVLGDGMNDLSLFTCFPYSFAPGNSDDKIKELAYKVVSDCDDDGFKEAIDMMVND